MRFFCGLMGLLVVPIAYLTVRGAGHSVAAGLVAALMVCYGKCWKQRQEQSELNDLENGLIANNRLILLDPPLLFFTSLTVLMWINFYNQRRKPIQFWWYIWLAATGAGLGLTVSCKWVGLFTIATIGTSTIKNLWEIWGNTRISKVRGKKKEWKCTRIAEWIFKSMCLQDILGLELFVWLYYPSWFIWWCSLFISTPYLIAVKVMVSCRQNFNKHWTVMHTFNHLLVSVCCRRVEKRLMFLYRHCIWIKSVY